MHFGHIIAFKFTNVAKTLDGCIWLKTHYIGNFFYLRFLCWYFGRCSSSHFWNSSNLLQCFPWNFIIFSAYLLWGKQIVVFSKHMQLLKRMLFRWPASKELVHWDEKASAASLGNRVHPDVEDARVMKQESPATPVLTGPLIDYANRHVLHNMCSFNLHFIAGCQSPRAKGGFMVLLYLRGVRGMWPRCEGGVDYYYILCVFGTVKDLIIK